MQQDKATTPATDTFDAPFREYPGYKLKIASARTMSQLAKSIAEFDVSITEATVLLFVEANPGCLQSELGQALNIASANVTTLVTTIEKKNLVVRQPADGRSKCLHLTNSGIPFTLNLRSRMERFEDDFLNTIPKHLRTSFLAALDHINRQG